jgi:hypothetical protein
MIKHIKCIYWGIKNIFVIHEIYFLDKILLCIKSFNLYLSFLAFTDRDRPFEQLHNTIICAMLSAIYDYDTDWKKSTKFDKTILFFSLLDKYINNKKACKIAKELFIKDYEKKLSNNGLERGSEALLFYVLVIKSQWMKRYSMEEINTFGRKLQTIDDVFDIIKDWKNKDKNCLLKNSKENQDILIDELNEFLESKFFNALAHNSIIYRLIKWKCKRDISKNITPSLLDQLIATSRPQTALFAFILTLIGFSFYKTSVWHIAILTSLGFTISTASIMTFNDLIDKEHDKKKKKYFASINLKKLYRYWSIITSLAVLILCIIIFFDFYLFLFCFFILGLGLFYSFIPNRCCANNMIVAFCSASPVLAGMIYFKEINFYPIISFITFFGIIMIREIVKDIEDRQIDPGYKKTIPIRTAQSNAMSEYWENYLSWIPKCVRKDMPKEASEALPFHSDLFVSAGVIGSLFAWTTIFTAILFKYWFIAIFPFIPIFVFVLLLSIIQPNDYPELSMPIVKKCLNAMIVEIFILLLIAI